MKTKKAENIDNLIDTIIHADVLDGLATIPDDTVSLVTTSPPYNVGIKYGDHNDEMNHQEYLNWMKKVWAECYRVLRPGGRLCVNIDMTANMGDRSQEYYRPLYADFVNINRENDFMFRAEIAWYKQNLVGSATAWGCYDDQTRVLTKNGLKLFADCSENDEFATLNPQTREIEYHRALQHFRYNYDGEMYRIKSKTSDLLITPNHNMPIYNSYKDKIELREIKNAPQRFSMPKSHFGLRDGELVNTFELPCKKMGLRTKKTYRVDEAVQIDMNDWLAFLGIFLTDGNVDYCEKRRNYRVSIYQSKDKYLSEIKDLLKRLPFTFTHKEEKSEFYVNNKSLAWYMQQLKLKNERVMPDFVFNLPPQQKKHFLHWLMIGDGYEQEGKYSYFPSVSKELANGFVRLAIDCGYMVSVTIKEPNTEPRIMKNGNTIAGSKQLYIINFLYSKLQDILPENVSKENYKGEIFCVEVPNNILLVERNGKFAWSGNSYQSCSNPIIRRNHEYILIWSKGSYKLDGDKENCDLTDKEFQQWTMSMWFIQPETRKLGSHHVPYPEELVKRLVKLYCYQGDIVLDPFMGTGTTAVVAKRFGRKYIGIDNDLKSVEYARKRIACSADMFE